MPHGFSVPAAAAGFSRSSVAPSTCVVVFWDDTIPVYLILDVQSTEGKSEAGVKPSELCPVFKKK